MRASHLAIAVAIAFVSAGPAEAQQVIGVSSAVKNDVRIRKPGAPLPRPVQVKQRVALADQVQTGVKSQLQVLLLDRSVFTVGANARLTIDRYVYDPNRNSRSLGATVTKGAFRFMSGKRTNGGSSSINTPVASIGVRGTIVDGVVGEAAALIAAEEQAVGRRVQSDPLTATLVVLRGPGQARQGNDAPGAITVTAGGRSFTTEQPLMAFFVPRPGAAPIGPFRISNSGLMQIQALINPPLAQRFAWREPADNLATVPPDQRVPIFPPSQPRPRPPRGMSGGAFGMEDEQPGVNLPTMPTPGVLTPPPPRPRPGPAPTPTQPGGPVVTNPPQQPTTPPRPTSTQQPQQPARPTSTPAPTPAQPTSTQPSVTAAPPTNPPLQSPTPIRAAPVNPQPTPAPTPTPIKTAPPPTAAPVSTAPPPQQPPAAIQQPPVNGPPLTSVPPQQQPPPTQQPVTNKPPTSTKPATPPPPK